MIELTYGDETALVGFPYEYLPLPVKGQTVEVANRNGVVVGQGVVVRVLNNKAMDMTNVVYVEVAREIGEEVRSVVRK